MVENNAIHNACRNTVLATFFQSFKTLFLDFIIIKTGLIVIDDVNLFLDSETT